MAFSRIPSSLRAEGWAGELERMEESDWLDLPPDEHALSETGGAMPPRAASGLGSRRNSNAPSGSFDDYGDDGGGLGDDGASQAEGGAMLPPMTEEDAEGGAERVAPFLVKLYEIVSSESLNQHITWSAAGDTLRIVDPAGFARDVLPRYFKHSNLRSFIRQLNMYGFCRGPTKGARVIEFFHERFCRGGRAHLKQVHALVRFSPGTEMTRWRVQPGYREGAQAGSARVQWDEAGVVSA
jgi:hypothetical protein